MQIPPDLRYVSDLRLPALNAAAFFKALMRASIVSHGRRLRSGAGSVHQAVKGDVIDGRYRLESLLGHGAMGEVWQAHDTKLGVNVAAKHPLFPPRLSADDRENLVRRARLEAANALKLRARPNIVTVFDVVADDDGLPWMIMDLVDGVSADKVIGQANADVTTLVATKILNALASAHAQGITHRDVKPSNIMLVHNRVDDRPGAYEDALLTDFGIARHHQDTRMTEGAIGTPEFMAPEVWSGNGQQASDLFALGVTLYQVTGSGLPFKGANHFEVMHAVLNHKPPPPMKAGRLRPLIIRLMAKDPAKRPTAVKALEMLEALVEPPKRPRILPTARQLADGVEKLVNEVRPPKTPRPPESEPLRFQLRNTTKLRLWVRTGTDLQGEFRTVAPDTTKTFDARPLVGDHTWIYMHDADGTQIAEPTQLLCENVDEFVAYDNPRMTKNAPYRVLILPEGAPKPRRQPWWKRKKVFAWTAVVVAALAVFAWGVWYTGMRSMRDAHAGDCVSEMINSDGTAEWHLVTCTGQRPDKTYRVYTVLLRIDGTTDTSLCSSRASGWNPGGDTEYIVEAASGKPADVLCLHPR